MPKNVGLHNLRVSQDNQCRFPGLQIWLHIWKLLFLFLNQNICFGYSKEWSQWDGSFEHPRYMFQLIDKEKITILHKKINKNA